MTIHYLPEEYNSVNSFLIVPNADKVIEFLIQVFNAEEKVSLKYPDGKISHAVVQLGSSRLMLCEANDDFPARPSVLVAYVPDVDTTYAKALAAGAQSIRPPVDRFFGDRTGGVIDVGGNQWWIHTHIEDVSSVELQRRAAAI